MKFLFVSATALLMTEFVTASTEKANAAMYCQYVSYHTNCVTGPVVVLRARHVVGAAAREQ